jgi:hypothetical protein
VTTLTDDQIAYLRSEVGDTPDDATLQDKFDRLGSTVKVAAEIVSGKLAVLEGQASSTTLSIPGVISESESYDATLRALSARQTRLLGLAALQDQQAAAVDDGDGVARVTRADRAHR